LVITQNGEAKAVMQDVASFEETQETLALLKILALGAQDVADGKVKPVADVVARLRAKRAAALMARSPEKFEVLLTAGAERELEAIHDYTAEYDCVANANDALDRMMDVVESLARFPERGTYPKELVSLGIKAHRQTVFKPYRVIYRVTGVQVVIHLIADGPRDMQSLLARRLLGA
jgi:toxin ParE1/3/4